MLFIDYNLMGVEDTTPLSLWDTSVNLKGGFGYKDNVLLANFAPQASAFTLAGLEFMAFRLPTGNTEFIFFVSGEDRHYLRSVGVSKEQTLITQAQVKQSLGRGWQTAMSLQYFYLDQVFDVSATENDLSTVKLQGHGLTARPALRKELAQRHSLELEVPITRQYFAAPLDDYWEGGPKLTWTHEYGHRSEWSVSAAFNHRSYDQRTPTDFTGLTLSGESLEFNQPLAELAWRHHWDQKKRWRTVTKTGYEYNHDNGSGFYDYHRYALSQQLRYQAPSWEVVAQAKAYFYHYPKRPLSTIDSNKKRLTSFLLNLRAQKALYKKIKLFAEYEYERLESNQTGFGYAANTILSGLDWEF